MSLTATPALYDTTDATAKSVAGIGVPNKYRAQKTLYKIGVFFCGRVTPLWWAVRTSSEGRFCVAVTPIRTACHPIEIGVSGWQEILPTQRPVMANTISRRPVASNSIPNQIDSILTELVALSEGIAYLDPKETPDGVLSALAFIQLNKLEALESLIDSLGVRA